MANSDGRGGAGRKRRIFTTAPVRAIADTRLTALDLRCLMVISLHDGMSTLRAQGGGGCYAKSATLAELARTDISNFSKSVSRLIALKYVSRESQLSDKRRFTLRVIWHEDTCRVDQRFSDAETADQSEVVGEPTNHLAEIVGEAANEIVGEALAENGGNQPFPDPHYILRSRELNSEESDEIDSAEAAHLACSETRHDDPASSKGSHPQSEKDPAEAGCGRSEPVSIVARLPRRFNDLETAAQLASFERVFNEIGRDPNIIEASEHKELESLLFSIADAFAGEQVGHQAMRLLEEMDLAA